MTSIKLPKFSLISLKHNVGGECEHCGHQLKHVVTLKNNETQEYMNLGTGCVKTLTGQTLKEINQENKSYTVKIQEFDIEQNSKARVQNFVELNPEMMEYIEANLDNSFIRSMKTTIEATGTLTANMYAVVYSMMLPVAELADKADLDVKLIRVKKDYDAFGYNPGYTYTLYCETELNELVRVYFSSINEKTNELFLKLGICDSSGDFVVGALEQNIEFNVKGSFDGYKLKRVKISELV